MSPDQFMLWRFRTTEGILADILSWNMTECVFKNGSKFIYDNTNEIITIENHNSVLPKTETMRFSELTKHKLFCMGFKERPELERHSSSYYEGTYQFQFPAKK